ncbi:MAG: Tat pathway signal protein [Alphaproteobacteria bacterium]|nr:Tat pathway signal protein [Alphaproteobacteria bacterium]
MIARRLFVIAACAALAAPVSAQPSSSSASADRSRALTSAESFVPLPTLTAGVLSRRGNGGTLVVDVGLDVRDAALRRRARASGPRLRDALRTALSTYANTYYRSNTAPDPTTIARLMQTAVNRTLGGGGARLLLSNIVFQAP